MDEKTKILIVEDVPHLRLLFNKILTNAGYEVVEAEDGFQGIRCLQLDRDIRLVLLDIMMPNMNGVEFLTKIQRFKKALNISICMITAKSSGDDIKECLALGADDYLVKTVDKDILLDKVKILLDKSSENRFSSVDAFFKAQIINRDEALKVNVLQLSEIDLHLQTEEEIELDSEIHIESKKLQEILQEKNPIIAKVYQVFNVEARKYLVKATFVGIMEKRSQKLRSVTLRGEKIED